MLKRTRKNWLWSQKVPLPQGRYQCHLALMLIKLAWIIYILTFEGLAQKISLSRARYFFVIDDYLKKVKYVIKQKDQFFEKLKKWKMLVENQTNNKVKNLRTVNGLELCNRMFDGFVLLRVYLNTRQWGQLLNKMALQRELEKYSWSYVIRCLMLLCCWGYA